MPDRKRGAPKPIKSDLKPQSASSDSTTADRESQFDQPAQTLDLEKKVNHNKSMGKSKGVVILVLVLLVLAGAGAAAYTYGLYQKSQAQIKSLKANPQEIAKAETKQTVDAVGKLITLPSNETPTIATVTDAKKLKNQAFFSKAENGDKVLIYTNAKKAILYREKINKIIEVAPVNIGQAPSPGVSPAAKTSPTPAKKTTVTPKVSPPENP